MTGCADPFLLFGVALFSATLPISGMEAEISPEEQSKIVGEKVRLRPRMHVIIRRSSCPNPERQKM
jgi:hypothetical protein